MAKTPINMSIFYKCHSPWYRIDRHWWHFCDTIKHAWQRMTKGYCDVDRFSIYYQHTGTMINILTELRDNKFSCPARFYEKYGDEKCHEEWAKYLTKIINSFYECEEDTLCEKERIIWENKNLTEAEKFKAIENLWKESEEIAKDALQLLGEVYFDLWD